MMNHPNSNTTFDAHHPEEDHSHSPHSNAPWSIPPTTSEPASSSNLKYQRRRRRRSSWWHSTMTSCISQWWMTQWCSTMCRPGPPQHVTCCRGSSRIPFVVSSSQKSSSSWCSWYHHHHHSSNGTTTITNSSSSSSSNSSTSNGSHNSRHYIPILLLCLFGTILLLLIVIAYLVVLLMESSALSLSRQNRTVESGWDTTSTSSFHEYPKDDWLSLPHNTVPDDVNEKDTLMMLKHNLIDTPIYSKNAANSNNGTNPSHHNNINNNNQSQLQIVWLMSFPNSGTSYTSRLVRDVTQTFTASNYADETPEGLLGERRPVYTNDTYGPFWTVPMANLHEYQYPTRYVLTKTHCGIRCSLCSPNEYAETTYSFRRRCLVTKWVDVEPTTGHATNVYSTYPITHVEKAVHVVRNPFDNVVSRFHLEHTHPNRTAREYTPNRHGFLRYCLSIDYKYIQQEIKYLHFQENKLLQDLWLVPCHADFMRYIEWHNLAFITTQDLQLPTYVLHYDWYSTQYERVTTELLQFVQLVPVALPPPFVPGKVYDQYYTTKEKLIVKRAFEFMASSVTWEHIQQYFPPDP